MLCPVQKKVGYSKREYAAAAMPGLRSKYGQEYRTYRCNHCREWHMTTQAQFFGKSPLDAVDTKA